MKRKLADIISQMLELSLYRDYFGVQICDTQKSSYPCWKAHIVLFPVINRSPCYDKDFVSNSTEKNRYCMNLDSGGGHADQLFLPFQKKSRLSLNDITAKSH